MSWHTLYIMTPLIIELFSFNTLKECELAQERLLDKAWHRDFTTQCISFRGSQ